MIAPARSAACMAAIACAALAVAPRLARSEGGPARDVDPGVRRWLGKRAADAISHAVRGEIMRVDPEPLAPTARGALLPPNVGGQPIIGEVHVLDAKLLDGFRRALLDPETHAIPRPGQKVGKNTCSFEPGVALRLWPAGNTGRARPLEILLCFVCNDLLVLGPGGRPRSMSPGAARLLELSIAGLPEFEALRAIKTD